MLYRIKHESRHLHACTPSISGIRRRGVPPAAVCLFCENQIPIPEGLLFDDAREAGIFVKAARDKEHKAGLLQAKGRGLHAEHL